MGIGDSIFNRVKSDAEYRASSGISHGLASGVGSVIKNATTKKPVCSKCKNPLPSPPGKFCAKCGAALTIKCTKCNAEYAIGTGFCAACGTKLG
jgi:rRNA maturation endonuclease Nob1